MPNPFISINILQRFWHFRSQECLHFHAQLKLFAFAYPHDVWKQQEWSNEGCCSAAGKVCSFASQSNTFYKEKRCEMFWHACAHTEWVYARGVCTNGMHDELQFPKATVSERNYTIYDFSVVSSMLLLHIILMQTTLLRRIVSFW